MFPFTKLTSNICLKNHFFSNGNLLSLSLKNMRQQKVLSFRSNIQLLQSNFIPIRGYIRETVYQQTRNSPLRRSSTWKQYNLFYNRSNWDKLKKPLLFTIAFCVGTTLVTPYLFTYTPLSYFKRNPQSLLWSLIGINGARVFDVANSTIAMVYHEIRNLVQRQLTISLDIIGLGLFPSKLCSFFHKHVGISIIRLYLGGILGCI